MGSLRPERLYSDWKASWQPGHEVRLVPPVHVKPFVRRQKNDAADAEAICEAATRPTMRFVPVKSEEQQSRCLVFRARDLLVRQRLGKALHKFRRRCIATGRPSRRFRQFRCRTLKSWSRSHRVVAKAEWLPGMGGWNPRFVVSNLAGDSIGARKLHESLY